MATPIKPVVTVVGSLNVDYVASVGRLPAPGETISALDLQIAHGGKGANQAIAAARQETEVVLIGSVGQDEMGKAYIEHLQSEEINTERVLLTPVAPTGAAFVSVDDEGENMIVVASGANSFTAAEHVRAVEKEISESGALLAQFEVSLSAVVEGIQIANQAGVLTILNPSPVRQTFPWQEVTIDYLVVNEQECAELIDFAPGSLLDEESVMKRIDDFNTRSLIVTRGSGSTLAFTPDGALEIPTMPVLAIDTVGAGDAFTGCLAARLAGKDPLEKALRAANCAGALTTLGTGAQNPIPGREQVDQHMDQLVTS